MIERWDWFSSDHDVWMARTKDGDFVQYEDHQQTIEEIASKIDEVWREKGGINCTEVCAIVRAYGDRS